MLWRKLNRLFCRKGKLLTVVLVILWGIAGMYIQYQLYAMEAGHRKWEPLERLGDDWYYYRSGGQHGTEDLKKRAVLEKGHVLGMWQVRTYGADDMDVFQYSEEAWERFSYPLSDGNGFSAMADEIIVSPELAKEYPLGSRIKVVCDAKQKSQFRENEIEHVFTVVGVLGQGEIYFCSGDFVGNQEPVYDMMNGAGFAKTLFRRAPRFGIVNPALGLEPDFREESAGIFFQASQSDVSEMDVTYRNEEDILSVPQIVEEYGGYSQRERISQIGTCLILWVGSVLYLMFWQGSILQRSLEELSYLMYINFNKILIWRRFLRASASRLGAAWLISCMAYFLPNEYDWFWNMHWYIPVVAISLYVAAGCFGRWLSYMYFKERYLSQTQKYLGEAQLQNYLYIDELSVSDNLLLVLLAQNYPERTAARMVKALLVERDIYYRNRRMKNLDMQKKFEFYALRDELLTQDADAG